RSGNIFTGFVSGEGVKWIQVGQPVSVAMPSAILVGFAVSSGFASASSVVFDNVALGGPVGVSIDQQLVSLAAGQSESFTATVLGSTNQAVTWSLNPAGVGSISNTGLYTAPAVITAPGAVTITATSAADPTHSATTAVELGVFSPIRINAGGPAHID